MTSTMKAVQIYAFGGREVLELNDIAIPEAKQGEVLIKIHAASVNPVDWKIRQGYLQPLLNHALPLTMGWDVSGEVVAVGGGVIHLKVGDEVYSRPNIANNGSYAEYMTASAEEVALKPKSLTWQEAAGVPLAGLTAWQGLYELANIEAGEQVLIHGGSGAVGQFAIQLAKLRGATVYTTTSARNTDLVLSLGADHAIDYQQVDFSELRDMDVVLDTIGGEVQDKSWKTIKPGGRLLSIVQTPDEAVAASHGVTASFYFIEPDRSQLEEMARLADAGKLVVNIDSEFSLDQVADAHERSESGRAQGKIIINVAC
ncbi:MAG: NADP-dependent oxidoreductase [Pseudomonadales bacterium]